jgi:phosphotransferase system HPr (HPr) family protein
MKVSYRIKTPFYAMHQELYSLAKICSNYNESILISYNNAVVSLKSPLSIMSLSIKEDSLITIIVKGENSMDIIQEIETFLINKQLIKEQGF